MWAWTNASGRRERMPLDATPEPNGNVMVYRDDDNPRLLICDVIGSKAHRAHLTRAGWPLYLHHRLSCPKADRWARGPLSMRPAPPLQQQRPSVDTPDDGQGTLL